MAFIESSRDTLGPKNCYVPSEDDEYVLDWVLADTGGIGFFGYAYYSNYAPKLTVVRIASDKVKGVTDTADAKIAPTSYSITDGSYSVFTRLLYMNVDNAAWDLVRKYFEYGFSTPGQIQVAEVGYVAVNAALKAKMIAAIALGANPEADYNPVPPANCDPGMEMTDKPFINQFGKAKIGFECTPCPAGRAKGDDTTRKCSNCTAGFAAVAGQAQCTVCEKGTFAAKASETCSQCEINSVSGMKGAGKCDRCPAGMFAATKGSTQCEQCSAGKFRTFDPPLAQCVTCPTGMTTAFMAATKSDDCKCAKCSYLEAGGMDGGNFQCLSCPSAMSCPFGSKYDNFAKYTEGSELVIPLVDRGYFSLPSDPLSVYLCQGEGLACPGGPPKSCSGGHIGLVCAHCPDGETSEIDGDVRQCNECSGSFAAIPTIFIVVGIIGIVVVYRFANQDLLVNVSAASFDCWAIGFGILITANQVLAITSFFPWPRNILDFLKGLGLVLASTDAVSYDCMLSSDPNLLYMPRILAPFVCVFLTFLLFSASKVLPPSSKWTLDKTINTLGQILQVFYIAIAAIIVVPLQCYEHPNGEKSLQYYPQVLCWQSDHVPLLMMGLLVAVFFVIPFTAWCVWGTFAIVNPNSGVTDSRRLTQLRFLLFRFRPDCWWWNNVRAARQLLLAFTPALSLSDDLPHIQAAFMVTVLVGYIAAHCAYWPFKLQIFNNLELAVCLLLIQVILAGGTSFQVAPTEDFLAFWVFTTVSVIYIVIVAYFAFCVYRLKTAKDGSVEDSRVGGCTDEEIFALWQSTCKSTVKLSKSHGQEALMGMNVFDKQCLLKAMGVWYAVRSDHFAYNDKFRRIAGLGHTSTDAAKKAHKNMATKDIDETYIAAKVGEPEQKDIVAKVQDPVTESMVTSTEAAGGNGNGSGGLPEGWSQAIDPSTGKTYYYHLPTGETSWALPTNSALESDVLPAGWEQTIDSSSGKPYF